jgi:hypothetical protein
MFMSRFTVVIALLVLFTFASCSDSPTSPLAITRVPVTDAAVAGDWSVPLGIGPNDEDWVVVRMTLSVANGTINGQMLPQIGSPRPITGFIANGTASLVIGDLPPGAEPCTHVGIFVRSVETRGAQPIALLGRLGGRCPSTLMRDIRLERI